MLIQENFYVIIVIVVHTLHSKVSIHLQISYQFSHIINSTAIVNEHIDWTNPNDQPLVLHPTISSIE